MKEITVINEAVLKELKARQDGIDFFTRNIGEISVEKLKLVKGDCNSYVEWLNNAIVKYKNDIKKLPVKEFERRYGEDGDWGKITRNRHGDILTYKDSDDFSYECTYNKFGNILTYKNSDGFSYEYTRDENGNVLTFKNSDGVWKEYTRDKFGNILTHKDNEGYWCEYTRDETGNVLVFKDSNGMNTTYKYEHTKEYFKMYENDKLILTCLNKKDTKC